MLTVMCPNCKHRFPALGGGCCATPSGMLEINSATLSQCDPATDGYYRQQMRLAGGGLVQDVGLSHNAHQSQDYGFYSGVTGVGAGGGLIHQRSVVQPDARSLSCVAEAARQQTRPLQIITEDMLRRSFEQAVLLHTSKSNNARLNEPPSGCQELPGTRRESNTVNSSTTTTTTSTTTGCNCSCKCCSSYNKNNNNNSKNDDDQQQQPRRNLCQVSSSKDYSEHRDDSGDIKIQVNTTLRLPSSSGGSSGGYTLNITATTSTTPTHTSEPIVKDQQTRKRIFSSGGNVSITAGNLNVLTPQPSDTTNREESPATPISWVTPCPWGFDGGYDMVQKHAAKLAEVRKLLQKCDWFYEGLTWQQSEVLLKDAPIGRWLLRDSSDSRYSFAISAQTARGPTSVRVIYFMGKFRLDSIPGKEFEMPLFDCPFKMLEYYCDYERHADENRAYWVDCQCKLFAHIHMTQPLVKRVPSLSHLARLAANKSGRRLEEQTQKLPPVIKSYLDEYPYTV